MGVVEGRVEGIVRGVEGTGIGFTVCEAVEITVSGSGAVELAPVQCREETMKVVLRGWCVREGVKDRGRCVEDWSLWRELEAVVRGVWMHGEAFTTFLPEDLSLSWERTGFFGSLKTGLVCESVVGTPSSVNSFRGSGAEAVTEELATGQVCVSGGITWLSPASPGCGCTLKSAEGLLVGVDGPNPRPDNDSIEVA